MFNTSAIVEALQAAAASITDEQGSTWTGATAALTIPAEEVGTEQDVTILYFQLKDTSGAVYWVDESGMDELTNADMQDRLSI